MLYEKNKFKGYPVVVAVEEVEVVATSFQIVSAPTCTGEESETAALWPNWPEVPIPHVHKVLSVLVATANSGPEAILDQLVSAPTCTGELVLAVSAVD